MISGGAVSIAREPARPHLVCHLGSSRWKHCYHGNIEDRVGCDVRREVRQIPDHWRRV